MPTDLPQLPGNSLLLARASLKLAAWLFPAVLGLVVLGYLAWAVPASWFPSAVPREWSATDMQLARGVGRMVGNELEITATDANGMAVVSLKTDLKSTDYRAIAWRVTGLPDSADAQLIWNNDYQSAKLNSVPLSISNGSPLPVVLARDPAWIGKVGGIALVIRGALAQPVRVSGATAKPMGAFEVLGDRVREWTKFETWSGTSINTLAGGADVQRLPLPALLATTTLLAALAWFALARRRAMTSSLPLAIAAMFLTSWLLVDLRWTVNLVSQVRATAAQFAGKDARERSLAAVDGPLFAFVEKARAAMPAQPARVFMLADADYFRGRGAYHLYPHNVFFDPSRNAMPARAKLRSGDFLVVYQRRGIQFNAAEKMLRWEGAEPLGAEALVVEPGAALFRVL